MENALEKVYLFVKIEVRKGGILLKYRFCIIPTIGGCNIVATPLQMLCTRLAFHNHAVLVSKVPYFWVVSMVLLGRNP